MIKRKMAATDLTVDSLPHTRKELFFDTLKLRWKLLFVLGIFFAICLFPTLLVFFLKDVSLQSIRSNYDFSSITNEQYLQCLQLCREQSNFWNLFLLPCFILIGIYLAGFMRVIRQLNYSEGIHPFDDFKKGIKQNWKYYLLFSIISFIIFYLSSLIANIGIDNVFAQYLPVGLSIIIFVPLLLNMMSLSVTYNIKIKQLFKTAFVFSFKNILWYLLFIIGLFLPIALFFIPYYLIIYIIFFVISSIYYPIYLLANYMFNFNTFDEYINKENYKDYYHKGLY